MTLAPRRVVARATTNGELFSQFVVRLSSFARALRSAWRPPAAAAALIYMRRRMLFAGERRVINLRLLKCARGPN